MADDFDKVWEWETNDEQDRWDEAQREGRDAAADRFDREQGDDVP
jgi:hypothetical protein